MGFEHQIYFDITDERKRAIQHLLSGHPFFSKVVTVGGNDLYEFRKTNADYKMPDFSFVIEKTGLYYLNNLNADLWEDFEFIRKYLNENGLNYKIEEL